MPTTILRAIKPPKAEHFLPPVIPAAFFLPKGFFLDFSRKGYHNSFVEVFYP